MLYCAEGFALKPIRRVFCGEANDVLVCRNLASPLLQCYTVWVVKSPDCVKKLLAVFEAAHGKAPPYLCRFAQNDEMIFVFGYRPERRLSVFCGGQLTSDFLRESACVSLVLECLAGGMPYPLLCRILAQDNVNIEKDNSVFFSFYLDLSELEETDGEAECANLCAAVALSVFNTSSRLKSTRLIRKKHAKLAYGGLTELYRDIRLTAVPEAKRRLRNMPHIFWESNRDRLFKALLAASAAVVAVTLVVLLSRLIWGDVPLFRLFEHSFDVIGTETLK